jgi:hypothetical protein
MSSPQRTDLIAGGNATGNRSNKIIDPVRVGLMFDPFRVGICFAVRSVGVAHGY